MREWIAYTVALWIGLLAMRFLPVPPSFGW